MCVFNPTASFNLLLGSTSWELIHLGSLQMLSDRRWPSIPISSEDGCSILGNECGRDCWSPG